VFRSGRQFAAYLGLCPAELLGRQERLGHISKMGNGYLRRLLVVGRHLGDPQGGTQPDDGPAPG
jgi:transposase